jgi:hypothetical protein
MYKVFLEYVDLYLTSDWGRFLRGTPCISNRYVAIFFRDGVRLSSVKPQPPTGLLSVPQMLHQSYTGTDRGMNVLHVVLITAYVTAVAGI